MERTIQENMVKEMEKEINSIKEQFIEKIKNTFYFKDVMDQFCDIVKLLTSSTGVYIGELMHIRKPISDDDLATPPVEDASSPVITYIGTSQDHTFMKEKYLEQGKGVTFPAIKPTLEEDDKDQKEGGDVKKSTEEDKIKKAIINITEVLREDKMHYFKVPKLGSYVVIPIVQKSCVNDSSLETALADQIACNQKMEEQEKIKKEYDEKVEEEKAKAEENEEEYKAPDPPVFQEFKLPSYLKTTANYVLCFDSMGQDRKFTEKQIDEAFNLSWQLKTIWDSKEEEMVTHDKNMRLAERSQIKEHLEHNSAKIAEEEQAYVKKQVDGDTSEDKEFLEKYYKYCFLTESITSNIIADIIVKYPEYYIAKFPNVFQALLFLLGYTREEICLSNTNNLNWRESKKLIDKDLLAKIKSYQVRGAKENAPPKYMIINNIVPLISDIKEEEIEQTYYVIAQLTKWIKSAIEIRTEDIKRRKQKYQHMLEVRASQEKQNEEIQKEREDALARAKEEAKNKEKPAEGKEEKNEFSEEEFLKEWDAAHPSILIDDAPKPDMDADYEEQ